MNKETFIEELKKLGIKVNSTQMKQFDQYYNLLIEWNKKINLTRIINEEEVYLKHFYDSATINKVIDLNKVNNICDIGTGAGFPGIVIKILNPSINVTLVDSLEKRCIFLKEVIKKLNLTNINVYHARAEEFARDHNEEYDILTSRAVASLPVLIEISVPMIKIGGYMIALKANVDEELKNSNNAIKELNIKLEKKEEFDLPLEKSKRNILLFKKISKTSKKYPRKFDKIKKNNL